MKEELRKIIFDAVRVTYPGLKIKLGDIYLEHPTVEEFGDYSTNVALKFKLDPEKILSSVKLQLSLDFDPRAQVRAGFINFWLPDKWLVEQMGKEVKTKPNGRKIVIELVSPNINKPLHIGHLRNAALGMCLANLYAASGWEVVKDEINNDRGLHIMKAAYGYLVAGNTTSNNNKSWRELLNDWLKDPGHWDTPKTARQKPDFFVGQFYVQGEKLLTEDEKEVGAQLAEMLQAWEAEDKDVWKLWRQMSDWVHEGIDASYLRLGVKHDKKWYEHLLYKEGREHILEALKKGVFEQLPDGAVQANLEKFGLANKILIRRDGTAIYMTFDIALTKHKVAEFKADKYVWVVGNDQIDHFKRLFVIFEMLGMGKIDQFYHLAYGMVRVPGAKMSSRLGNVILADDLLDKIKELAAKLNPETAEEVAVGAVKYAMLKVDPMMDVTFDLEKSVSLEGDSGPYIQYTYARAKSVLRKSQIPNHKFQINSKYQFSNEEMAILRYLYRFPEVVEAAAQNYAPNLVCTCLFELAKRFNNLYNNCPILENDFRLMLTEQTSHTLKNGLGLLGIAALEKM